MKADGYGGTVLSTTFYEYCYVNVRNLPRNNVQTLNSGTPEDKIFVSTDSIDGFYQNGIEVETLGRMLLGAGGGFPVFYIEEVKR